MFRSGPALLTAFLFLTLGADRTATRADRPVLSERVVTYRIRAVLKPDLHTVHGEMDLVWRNTSDVAVDQLYFHLYLNAFRDRDSSYLRESAGAGKRGASWDEQWPGSITVNRIQLEDGTDLRGADHFAFEAPDDGNEKDATLARVKLPAPAAPGETVALRIDFDSRFPRVLHRTGWAGDPHEPEFFMCAQWFPKIAVLRGSRDGAPDWNRHQFHKSTEFFSDFGEYEVSLTVPLGWTVGATGRRLAAPVDNGDGTITVGYRQEDVHDFAWTASPHFHEQVFQWTFDSFVKEAPAGMGERILELLERTARHRGEEPAAVKPARSVTVRLLCPRDHAGLADRFRWAAGASLAAYGIWFGEYPYDTLTIVDPPAGGPAAGGMEYPTLITVWGDRTAPSWVTGLEGVTIHEFGHQYFYGLVASNEFEEAWLDEGMTSFTDARVFQEAYGPRIASTRYRPVHTSYFRPITVPSVFGRVYNHLPGRGWLDKLPRPWSKPDTLFAEPRSNGFYDYLRDLPALHLDRKVPFAAPLSERRSVLRTRSQDAMVMPGWHFASRGDYGVNSYPKPTLFFYCLRGLMGEEAFDRALHTYAQRYRFRHPTTNELLATLRDATPVQERAVFDGFVDAMVESAARVDVAILSVEQRKREDGKFEWTVRVQRRGDVPLPIEVRATGSGGETVTMGRWWSRARETTRAFRVVRDDELRVARLGPDWLRNVDSNLSNNARRVGPGDQRAAAVLATRWSLFAEEVVRTYAGLAR